MVLTLCMDLTAEPVVPRDRAVQRIAVQVQAWMCLRGPQLFDDMRSSRDDFAVVHPANWSLDMHGSDSSAALAAAFEAAREYLDTAYGRQVAPTASEIAEMALLDHPLGDDPDDPVSVVRALHEHGSPATVASTGGRFYGLVVGGTLPAALGARVLASAWDQVVFSDATSPIGCALERVASRWLLDILKLPSEAHLSFVTGTTMGSVTCLLAARQCLLARVGHDVVEQGLWGAPRLRVVASEEIHVTILKSLSMVGFGRSHVELVKTDAQGRVLAASLPPLDACTIVCLQAGNVNSGAFDPFESICERARNAGAWVHVDGAFGLWAAGSPAHAHLTRGVELADSWVTDGHKFLNTPYDCGMAIVRHPAPLHAVMATQAPYLKPGVHLSPKDMCPEFSRSARGVEVWAALRSLGRKGVADLIERCCRHARNLSVGLQALGYCVLNEVVLNIVVAAIGDASVHERITNDIQSSGECWFGMTSWRGRSAVRIAVSSWSTTDEDIRRTLAAIECVTRKAISAPTTF